MKTSTSRMGLLEACPRKYYWRYLGNRGGKTGVKQEFGIIIHEALAIHYRGGNLLEAFDFEVSKAETGGDAEFQKLLPVWRQRMKEYPKYYEMLDKDWEILLTPEAEMELSVGKHKLYVRVDLIIRSKKDGRVWVVDHKTTARTGGSWWTQFFVDKQGTGYTLAAEEVLGEEIAGWLINVIKPTKSDYFERDAFTRTQQQRDTFKRQMEWRLDHLEGVLKEFEGIDPLEEEALKLADRYFQQHTGACHGFGTCPFIGACQVGPGHVKQMLLATMDDRKLSPVDEG